MSKENLSIWLDMNFKISLRFRLTGKKAPEDTFSHMFDFDGNNYHIIDNINCNPV